MIAKKQIHRNKNISSIKYDPFTGTITGRTVQTRQNGYQYISIKKKKHYVHRFAFYFMGVSIPEGKVVDHIDGDPSNNRWSNLRLVSLSGNQQNTSRKGYSLHKRTGKWRVEIQLTVEGERKRYYGGYFSSEEEAASAAYELRKKHHEFMRN